MGVAIKKLKQSIYITGSGCCGFIKAYQILVPHLSIIYKSSPVKYQNSFQLKYSTNKYLRKYKQFRMFKKDNFIHPAILYHAEKLIKSNPNTKIICLKGEKYRTIESLKITFGYQNPFLQKSRNLGVGFSRYDLQDYPYLLNVDNNEKLYEKYYDMYYEKSESLKKLYPKNFFIIDSSSDFLLESSLNELLEIKTKIGVFSELPKKPYKNITTLLSGGLGNNLFQMAEAYSIAVENKCEDKIEFGKLLYDNFNYKQIPDGYAPDLFLGGHEGTLSELNLTFPSLNFSNKVEIDCDTQFISTDMFNFGRVRHLNAIREKFEANAQDLPGHIGLHLRFGGLKADHHLAENITDDRYIKLFRNFSTDSKILIYSDNEQQSLNFIQKIQPLIPLKMDYAYGNVFQQLRQVIGCEYQVIHSSTLSYWVALLSPNYAKNKIYYPKEIFKKHHRNMFIMNEWKNF